MPRALLYYLAQTCTADLHRQTQRDAPARAASQACHSRPSRAPPGGLAVRGTSDAGAASPHASSHVSNRKFEPERLKLRDIAIGRIRGLRPRRCHQCAGHHRRPVLVRSESGRRAKAS